MTSNTPTSILASLQSNAKLKSAFDKRPEPLKRVILEMLWNREVKSKLPTSLSENEFESAKQTFVDRFLKSKSQGPIYQEPTPSAGEYAGTLGRVASPFIEGLASPMAKGAELVGKAIGVQPSGSFRNVAEAAKETGKEFSEAHPFISGVEKTVLPMVAAGGLEALAGPAIAETMGASALGRLGAKAAVGGLSFTPFAESVSDIPKEFATGAVLGPVVGAAFGGAAKGLQRAVGKTASQLGETALEAEQRALLTKLGIEAPANKRIANILADLPKDQIDKFTTEWRAVETAKREAAKAATEAERATKKAGASTKEADKRVEKYTLQYGQPLPSELENLKAGGVKAQKVFDIAKQKSLVEASARAKLVKMRITKLRKASKVVTPEQIEQINKDVSSMQLADVNNEVLGVTNKVGSATQPAGSPPQQAATQTAKPATSIADIVRVPQDERRANALARSGFEKWVMATEGMTPEQFKTLPAMKREQFVQAWKATKYYELANKAIAQVKDVTATTNETITKLQSTRPDITKAVEATAPKGEQAQAVVTKVDTVPTAITIKNKAGDVVNILSPDEAKLATNVDLALKRLRENAVADVQAGMSTKGIETKYGALIKFLQQPGMDRRLQEDFANAVKDIPTVGRPTKAAAAAKPPEVRAAETAQREAETVSEKKKAVSRALADEAGPAIKYDDKLQAFAARFRRQPSEAEKLLLSREEISIGQAVDPDVQAEFEKAHPDLFPDEA